MPLTPGWESGFVPPPMAAPLSLYSPSDERYPAGDIATRLIRDGDRLARFRVDARITLELNCTSRGQTMKNTALSLLLISSLAACGNSAESMEDTESTATGSEISGNPPAARPPAPPARAIPAGTILTFEVREEISSSSHNVGDAFDLVLVDAVSGQAGASLPAGTIGKAIVTESHSSTGPNDQALLALRVASIEVGGTQRTITSVVQSAAIETSTRDSNARTAATIATGAAAGAIIGQILGQDTRSTVAGAAVGTAAGVGVALTSRDGNATLTEGSRIQVRLDQELLF